MARNGAADQAWILLAIPGVALLFGGVVHLTADHPVASGLAFVQGNLGLSWAGLVAQSPETARTILGFQRMFALALIAFSLLHLAVVTGPYRRGERWAWFAAWPNPIVLAGVIVVATAFDGWGTAPSDGFAAPTLAILVAMGLIGLFLPVRTFFPGREAKVAEP